MKIQLLASTNSMKIEFFFDENFKHKNLVYIFTPSFNRNLNGMAYGGDLFFRGGYDVIVFKISNDDWFQSIPPELFTSISGVIAIHKYEKKVAYGSSMGGYAAIAFSKILDCNTVIVFSPQHSIDQSFDRRWEAYAKKINFIYTIACDTVNQNCKFFIFYDDKGPDELQVSKILDVIPSANTCLIRLPYAGHPTTHYLAQVGILKELAIKVANENSIDNIDFRGRKALSKSYLQCISYHLLRRNKLKSALFTIDSAIQIDQNIPAFHWHKSTVLAKLGRSKEAIDSINNALSLDPSNVKFQIHLSNLQIGLDEAK